VGHAQSSITNYTYRRWCWIYCGIFPWVEQISKMTKRTPPKIQQKIIADNKTGKYTHLQIG
jgi:hypothetical protein